MTEGRAQMDEQRKTDTLDWMIRHAEDELYRAQVDAQLAAAEAAAEEAAAKPEDVKPARLQARLDTLQQLRQART